jgi:glycosyltransferase involved in cell wall biosynthesis
VAAAACAGKPVWIKAHGTDRFHLGNVGRRKRILVACDRAAGVMCVSNALAEALRQAGVAGSKLHVVSNGVDTTAFHYRRKEEAWKALGGVHSASLVSRLSSSGVVLFVGNLVRTKGPDILLKAWQQMAAREPPAALAIIGDGPLRGELESEVARLGLDGSAVLLGSRPHNEVALWMNAADCLCLASRSEGLPNVVLEALVSGLPVVATDVGGVRAALGQEAEATVVPSGDPAALAEALRQMLGRTVDRRALSAQQGRIPSWQDTAARTLALLGGGKREA